MAGTRSWSELTRRMFSGFRSVWTSPRLWMTERLAVAGGGLTCKRGEDLAGEVLHVGVWEGLEAI